MTPDGNPICFHQGSQHSSESNPSFQTKTFKNFDQNFDLKLSISHCSLSGHVPEIQAEVEVVKIKNPDFSCWGHIEDMF